MPASLWCTVMKNLKITDAEIILLERILDDRKQLEWLEENPNDNAEWFTIVNLYKKVLAMKGEIK